MILKLRILALAIALIGVSDWALADETHDDVQEQATKLPEVLVSEKRSNHLFQHDKVSRESIIQRSAVDLRGALNDLVGVEVVAVPGARQGNDSVNIRGIDGNRVAMDIDGIDVPETQETKVWSSQGVVFGRGAFMDNSALSSISVNRQADSGGLVGRVSLKTVSAAELLNGAEQGGYIESAWNGIDDSRMYSIAVAMQRAKWRGLLLGTFRHGHETKNRGVNDIVGTNRTKPDPLDYNSRYLLTKQEWLFNEHHSIEMTGEYLNRNQWANLLSNLDASSHTYDTRDKVKRARLSLTHYYQNQDNPYVQNIETQLYWQKTDTDSYRYSVGNFFSPWYTAKGYRAQSAVNSDKSLGLNTVWQSRIQHHSSVQNWRYGLKFTYRDLGLNWYSNYIYLQTGLGGGTVSKPFADSKQTNLYLFADDDWQIGSVTIRMGLGMHYYRISPSSEGYRTPSSEGEMKNLSKVAFTPKLGIAWQWRDWFIPYAQYTRGFKAPSIQQMTNSFYTAFGYGMVGNPNLRPETSDNFELGIRGMTKQWAYGIAVFDNRYRNLIDFELYDPALTLYRYTNLAKARIYGSELYAHWHFADDWKLKASMAYSRGHKTQDGYKTPLNSVLPLKVKLGLSYTKDKWGANAMLTHSAAKKLKDTNGVSYSPHKRYTLIDLDGYWQPNRHLSIHFGVNNLFNQKYWNWSDIAYLVSDANSSRGNNLTINQNNADRYTAAGRYFNIGIRYTF